MEDIRFQLVVERKSEVPMADGSIQYSLEVRSEEVGITGQLSLVVTSPEMGALVDTGKKFDVVMTPSDESS